MMEELNVKYNAIAKEWYSSIGVKYVPDEHFISLEDMSRTEDPKNLTSYAALGTRSEGEGV